MAQLEYPSPTVAPKAATQPRIAPERRSGYLPTLDGWRAIAISIVLLNHGPTVHLWRLSTVRFHSHGYFGVMLFFGISGLLICSRLLDEEEATGSLHLRNFYTRRLFRIQPVALSFLGFLLVLNVLHRVPPSAKAWFAALLLVRNYVGNGENARYWATAHYWSLSVEEHFYLVLPTLLVLVRRWRARLLLGLAAVDAGWFLYALHRAAPDDRFHVSARTDTCICLLLLPAAMAILLRRRRFRQFAARYFRIFLLAPLTLLALRDNGLLQPLLVVLPTLLVVSTLLHPGSAFSKFLEFAPLRFVGRISYSLYLWQQLFLITFCPNLDPFGRISFSLWVYPVLFMVATASYYLIERPFIRIGHRLARSATLGRAGRTRTTPAEGAA